jgi:RHS repeat-associated protein
VSAHAYDANGNTLSDAQGRSFTWDFENRLVQATVPGTNGGTTTFKYDPFGRRIQKSGLLATTNYLYDGMNDMEELDNSGNTQAKYTQGKRLDEPLSQLRSGTTSYYDTDGLGSITSLANASGALANTYSYDSFGDLTASTGAVTNPFRYTGREFDSETGLYYLRARYFDPHAGRFLAEDPIGYRGGPNFYGYLMNNPLILLDPMGLCVTIFVGDRVYSSTGNTVEGQVSVRSDQTPLMFMGYTMENANAGDNHNKPPIPDGTFDAFIRRDHDPNRVELTGVKGYNNIQIRNGNYPSDFKGCIGVGTSHKTDFIGDSRNALNQILNIIDADGTGCITVVVQPILPPPEPLYGDGAKCGS